MAIRLYNFPKKVSLGPPLSPRVHAEKSGYSDKLQLHVSFVVAWACRSGNTPLKPANEKPSSSQWNDQTSVSHVHIYTYMYICVYRQENIPEERKCDSTKTIPKNHIKKKNVFKKSMPFFLWPRRVFFMFFFWNSSNFQRFTHTSADPQRRSQRQNVTLNRWRSVKDDSEEPLVLMVNDD